MEYYIITLATIFCSDAVFALGLNLQYGLCGTMNFGYIFFYALGAYIAGAAALGSQHTALAHATGEQFLFGLNVGLPYPVNVLAAAVVGSAAASLVGLTLMRSLRADFAALMSVALFLVAYGVIGNLTPLFNGYLGLSLIPTPLSSGEPSWGYLACCVIILILVVLVAVGITTSPMGRRMRAVRDRPDVVQSLGKSVFRTRWTVFVVGNGMAALAGAMAVLFLTGFSPSAWAFAETLNVYTAVIVGGSGSNLGTLLGTLLVGVGVVQGVLFLPPDNSVPYLIPSLQWVVLGLVTIAFIAFRPRGLVPERPPRRVMVDRSGHSMVARVRGKLGARP